MKSNKKKARIAGLLYLGVVLSGLFSLMYVPLQLIVWDDAAITFSNIISNETLFRLGIVISVLCYIFFLFLPLALYRLLKPVNAIHAKAMAVLAIVSVPIALANLQNNLAVLSLISGESYLKVFTSEQLQAQVMFQLNQYNNGIHIVQIFWGLWLFPFGYLVYRSGFLPKFLGILLMLGCFSYLINFFGGTLVNNYSSLGFSSFIQLPASLGEIGICLWLLIMGAKETKT